MLNIVYIALVNSSSPRPYDIYFVVVIYP